MSWLLLAPAELQDKNEVGRAGQASGECCQLGSQHVASIVDSDSKRRRFFKVGIPEKPELQVCDVNSRLAATHHSAALPGAPMRSGEGQVF